MYQQIKDKLRDAATHIDSGRYADADRDVRAAVKLGATPNDLSVNLGSDRMRAMRDWAREAK